jgi:glutaredoxin
LSKQTEQSNSFSAKITDLEKENQNINVKSSALINENDGLKNQLANISCKESSIMYFYGKECPHCQEVEKFIADNKISDKVKYDSLEVWHNPENAKVMKEKAQDCGLPTDQIGVPFVYSGGKCYLGAPKVEDFFRKTAETQ